MDVSAKRTVKFKPGCLLKQGLECFPRISKNTFISNWFPPVSAPVSKCTYIYSGASLRSVVYQSTIAIWHQKSLVSVMLTRLNGRIYCFGSRKS
ncbi:MAG: hypothetical protein ACXACA_07565 [Candidatus Ranarchaeia archaeon]